MKRKLIEMNKILLIISIVSTACILVRQFVLFNTPEWFGWGEEFGDLLYDACIGYLVTYWFYYLTVYRPAIKHKNRAYKLVIKRARYIVKVFNTLKIGVYEANQQLFEATGINMDSGYNYEQVLKFIKPME